MSHISDMRKAYRKHILFPLYFYYCHCMCETFSSCYLYYVTTLVGESPRVTREMEWLVTWQSSLNNPRSVKERKTYALGLKKEQSKYSRGCKVLKPEEKQALLTLTGSWTGVKSLSGWIFNHSDYRTLRKSKPSHCSSSVSKQAKCHCKWRVCNPGKVRTKHQIAYILGRNCGTTERKASHLQARLV